MCVQRWYYTLHSDSNNVFTTPDCVHTGFMWQWQSWFSSSLLKKHIVYWRCHFQTTSYQLSQPLNLRKSDLDHDEIGKAHWRTKTTCSRTPPPPPAPPKPAHTPNPPPLCPVQSKGQSTCQRPAGITATHQDTRSSAHSCELTSPRDASQVSAFREPIVQTHLDQQAGSYERRSS